MDHGKRNISRWLLPGLTAWMLVLCLVLATGTALARYRAEDDSSLNFKPRKPVTVCLGQLDETAVFTRTESTWVLEENGQLRLDFAVANGEGEDSPASRDQSFRVRLVSTLGASRNGQPVTLWLVDENGQYQATAEAISSDTLLHQAQGDGWIYTFLDEDGQELSWYLEGGTFAVQALALVIPETDAADIDTSVLQLEIVNQIEN